MGFGMYNKDASPEQRRNLTPPAGVQVLEAGTPFAQRRYRAHCENCDSLLDIRGSEGSTFGFYGTRYVRVLCPNCFEETSFREALCRIDNKPKDKERTNPHNTEGTL